MAAPNPPTDRDRARAAMALEHLANLRSLGAFSSEDTTDNEINFIAQMLRNERLDLEKRNDELLRCVQVINPLAR